ncbi:hypothetical protein R6Q57_002548 [Mikania cordata]
MPREKRGYVRLVGRMQATKDKVDSLSKSQVIYHLQSVVNVMMNIFQEHIHNANLSMVLSDMNIQIPRFGSSTIYLATNYHLQDVKMTKAYLTKYEALVE